MGPVNSVSAESVTTADRRTDRRGFTMVELIVVIGITTIGFVALINLQVGTIHGASAARDLQTAVGLADHVGQTMRLEALQWVSGHPSANPNYKFINNAPADTAAGSTNQTWLVGYKPTSGGTELRVGPVGGEAAYDAGALSEIGMSLNAHFCVHYRFTWLIPDVLMRADIRVMWSRKRANFMAYALCPLDMATKLHDVQSITMPVTVMRNVFVKQIAVGS